MPFWSLVFCKRWHIVMF